jgi:hypothetical protein
MRDVTDKQQDWDPIMADDPDPEECEAWFAEHEDEFERIKFPPHMWAVVIQPKGISEEEWERRMKYAAVHGEQLPEQIAAEEEVMAAREEEERDWTPAQKEARMAERKAASEYLDRWHAESMRSKEVHAGSNGDFDQLRD